MFTELPPFVANSTLPQWISAIVSCGLFGVALRFVIQWRGQSLGAEENIRDHYADELTRLRKEAADRDSRFLEIEDKLREMLDEEREKHEECRRDRDRMSGQIRKLENELSGIKRQISQYSADKLMILETRSNVSSKAPEAVQSAERVKRHDK